MPSRPNLTVSSLPHDRLIVDQRAGQPLLAVREAAPTDAKLREHAIESAKSVCLDSAEATGRADRARVFGIARGEVGELAAAIEISALCGDTTDAAVQLAAEVYAMLCALAR